MEVKKLNEKIYRFTLSLNDFNVNMGLFLGEDGLLLIDTGWAQTAEEVKERIQELDEKPVKWIILTHQHGDHIAGRNLLGPDATLIAHKKTRDALAGKYFHLDPLPGEEMPLIALEDEHTLHFNGEEIRIIPAPGHTDSDLIVYFVNSGVVFMGDLLFSESFPALFAAYGGDIDNLIQAIGYVLEHFPEDVVLIAGHGKDYSLKDLEKYQKMIKTTSNLIKRALADGKNVQEMIDEDLLKDWEEWSIPQLSTTDWINQVFDCLTGGGKKSIAEPLTKTIVESGIESALDQYHQLKENEADSYSFGENDLNMLGYHLLWREMKDEAIQVHKLNTREHPESANPYDSLGETYEALGEKEAAIESYQKALEIDPDFVSSSEALKRLEEKKEK
jgi:glyoxylase-like metal-dependent hydrolase (beta-lactamase superfamily II)